MNASYESIQAADAQLRQWISSILPGANVNFQAPGSAGDDTLINLYLLEIGAMPGSDTSVTSPLQIMLNYLVTAWGNDLETAHAMITDFTFAALESNAFEISLKPIPAAIWQSLNIAPRPACTIMVPLSRRRKRHPAKPVEHPLVLKPGFKTRVSGQVVDSAKKPLAGVNVTLPELSLSAQTDAKGMFFFEAEPAADNPPAVNETFELTYMNKRQSRQINRTVDLNGQTIFYIQLLEV